MPRVMPDGEATAWRAVIVTTHPSEDPLRPSTSYTSYAGPFARRNAASGAITRAKTAVAWRYSRRDESERPTVTGHVERSAAWERVEK